MGDLHKKDIARIIFLSTPLLFSFEWLLPRVILPMWQNYVFPDKSTKEPKDRPELDDGRDPTWHP